METSLYPLRKMNVKPATAAAKTTKGRPSTPPPWAATTASSPSGHVPKQLTK